MLILDIIFIFILALVLSGLFVGGLGWRHPARESASGVALIFLFLVLFFAMLAGRQWIPVFGPIYWGAPLLVLLGIGALIALLIAAVSPPPQLGGRPARTVVDEEAEGAGAVFGLFFWLLIVALLIALATKWIETEPATDALSAVVGESAAQV